MNNPTKEELKRDWESNRAHFDALAKFYMVNDKEYYDKYIAPFYEKRTEVNIEGVQKKRTFTMFVIIGVLMALIMSFGVLAYFLAVNFDKSVNEELKEIVVDSMAKGKNLDSDYMKALKFMSEKDYDRAEELLKKIPEDDPDYKNAQQLLKSIQYLKKYDKK
jgi:tetratricopeptide (TPR) repeat protein